MNLKYSKTELTQLIKEKAYSLGFFAIGMAKAEPIDAMHSEAFRQWIDQNYQAEMGYLANNLEKRLDPTLLEPGTKTILSLAYNYFPQEFIDPEEYQIAWYSYGKDYHYIVKEKLTELFTYINELYEVKGRVFCDTAPVLERYWAWKAGLGWIGKNTQLIIPKAGCTFFLGEIFIDIELDYDTPQRNRCGSCSKCIQVCPTNALEKPHLLNANKCISYQTIENRNEIAPEIASLLDNKIYGCDDCIKACPWTRFASPTQEPAFRISKELLRMTRKDWHQLTEKQYQDLFRKSAVKRAKFYGLTRNIKAVEDKINKTT